MKPSDLDLPPRFTDFRVYPGFDQFATALDLATAPERFQILNSATGSGKSVTAAAAAALRSARFLVLVGTKGLQAQWYGDGLVEASVCGHRNYPCIPATGTGSGIDDADADDPDYRCGVSRDRCGYLADVGAAKESRSVVTNYAYWLALAKYGDPGLLGEFDLLVMDEAHGAGDWLTRAVAVTISRYRLRKTMGLSQLPRIPEYPKIEQWVEWIRDWQEKARTKLHDYRRGDSGRRRIERLVDDLRMISDACDPKMGKLWKEPWVVTPTDDGSSVTFSPRWGSDFAEQYLFRGIPHILLTSATVTRQHAQYLGIPEQEMRYREIPSPFDPRRRPVIWVPTTRVDYRMSDGAKWKLHRRVDELIEAAIEQGAGNGVIHTGSYERTRELIKESKYAAAIISHRQDAKEFELALERFKAAGKEGRFAILASPRITEGIDLPDDDCRWGLILKVPFPNSLDPLTKLRLQDHNYRLMVVAETIQQMVGRLVRNANDFGTMLVLDNHWGDHVVWQCQWPGSFKAAFRTVRPEQEDRIEFLTRELVDRLPVARQVEMIGT